MKKMHLFYKRVLVLALTTANLLSLTPEAAKAAIPSNHPFPLVSEEKDDKDLEKENKKQEKEQEKEDRKREKEAKKQEKELLKQERHAKKEKNVKKEDYNSEWNLATIHVDEAETMLSDVRPVKVAIIDSGIDYTEDIDVYMRKNFIPGEDEVSIIYEDSCGHGTSIAGIIAAKDNEIGITGVNPNVQLYSARVLDCNKQAPIDRIVDAINWAIAQDVDIINLSFGTTVDSPALHEAIQAADSEGILLIAAAGNKDVIEYPAAYEEVIAVGSVDEQGERCEDSAMGESLELMAPGRKVVSTGDFGGLSVAGGTSLAAAHVTGVASLLWQIDMEMPADFIRDLLCFSANKYGNSLEYGHGLIDYAFALEQYETFKEVYTTQEVGEVLRAVQEDVLELNESEVLVFEGVDYVEGSWSTEQHGTLATETLSSGKGTSLSENAKKILKEGAMTPDRHFTYMTYYPELHGYTLRNPGGNHEYYSNYVFAYLYLTEIAVGVKEKNSDPRTVKHYVTADCPSYCKQTHENGWCVEQMKNRMNGLFSDTGITDGEHEDTPRSAKSWEQIMKTDIKVENNEQNRSIFIYGLALHTITDLFAHSTYQNGTSITHPEADNKNYEANRYACASLITQYLIEHVKRGEAGSLNDFLQVAYKANTPNVGTPYAKPVYNGLFQLARLSEYIKAVDSSFYQKYHGIFDIMNCK